MGALWNLLPQWVKDAINWIHKHTGIEVVEKYFSDFVDWLDEPNRINFDSINNSISDIEKQFLKSYSHNAKGLEKMFKDLGLGDKYLKAPAKNLEQLKSQLGIPNISNDIKIKYTPANIPLPSLFSASPDLSFSFEIPRFTILELTLSCIRFGIKYGKGNNQDIPNRWRFYIYPTFPFLPSPLDLPDKTRELFDKIKEHVNIMEKSVNDFLSESKKTILENGNNLLNEDYFNGFFNQEEMIAV